MVRFTLLAAAALLNTLSSAIPLNSAEGDVVVAHLAARDAPGIPAGFRRTLFLENFAPSSRLDTNKWQYDIGHNYPGGPQNWGTGEVQRYTSDANNLFINSQGVLNIQPKKNINTGEWTSSRIETRPSQDFQCLKGGKVRVQASIRLPTGNADKTQNEGFWPAFWLLSPAIRNNYMAWPSIGEIDILESVNGLPTAWNVAHCGTNPGGSCNEPSGLGGGVSMSRGVFHTLRIDIDRTNADWKQESISWYIDNQLTRRLTPANMNYDQSAWNSLAVYKKFILLNVAVGGSFPNALANKNTPTARSVGGYQNGMEVDYVVVWST